MSMNLNKYNRREPQKLTDMNTNITNTNTTDNTTQEARHLFFLEDNLEKLFAQGWITEEEYEVERDNIFQTLGDLYGFEDRVA